MVFFVLQDMVPQELREGLVVAAQFPHDQNWYRARIVGVSDSTLDLLYLDFGDRATVNVAMAKALRLEYCQLPLQAIPCRLSRVQPTGQRSTLHTLRVLPLVTGGRWNEKAIALLDSLTLCASWQVVMVMVEFRAGEEMSEVKVVDTTTDEDVDVAQQLVEEGVAEWVLEVCMFAFQANS